MDAQGRRRESSLLDRLRQRDREEAGVQQTLVDGVTLTGRHQDRQHVFLANHRLVVHRMHNISVRDHEWEEQSIGSPTAPDEFRAAVVVALRCILLGLF
jgi:hypothetical protein